MTQRVVQIGWCLVLCACAGVPVVAPPFPGAGSRPVAGDAPAVVEDRPGPGPAPGVDLEALLGRMTVEEKVGQLMMVGFAGKAVDATITELVRGRRVGGVCLFGRNVSSAAQIAQLNDDVRALLADGVPPFIAVDQEGGNVVRIADGNLVLPGNMVLGAARSPELAYEAGLAQGEDLRRLGFNMNLAPVLDVNTNPHNPIIGIRAFSDDVGLVSALGEAFVRGQQDARIVTVAKHFPGHGDVDADSHLVLPVVRTPLPEVRRQLEPFAAAMRAGLDGLMTAHIAMPALTGDETPATLSPRVLGSVLRDELGFDGIVVTDELEMDAIAGRYGVGRAAVLAVNAGADMVLIPWRVERKTEVFEALLAAARDGALPAARLDQAVRRILRAKLHRGVFEPLPPAAERLAALGEKRALAARIAEAGVTLVRSAPSVFPLPEGRKVAVISPERSLTDALAARRPLAGALVVPTWPQPERREAIKRQARELAERADVVVVGVANSRHVELVAMAALTGRPVVAVVLGAPYLATQVHQAKAVLITYSPRESLTEAAAAALAGERGTPGRLPVRLSRHPFGHGLDPVGSRSASRAGPAAAGSP